MKPSWEYIDKDGAIYPVDYKSTGVIETNKNWLTLDRKFTSLKLDKQDVPNLC